MAGYRNELDSSLRQLAELRDESSRLRDELDALRASSGGALATAVIAWRYARGGVRAAAVVGAATLLVAAGEGVRRASSARLSNAPLGVAVPLVPDAVPETPPPLCQQPRPCPERHRSDALPEDAPPTENGVITEGAHRGYRFAYPTYEDTSVNGTLIVRTRGTRTCHIDNHVFFSPLTRSLRPGEYRVECEIPRGPQQRWLARVQRAMVTVLVELPPEADPTPPRPRALERAPRAPASGAAGR